MSQKQVANTDYANPARTMHSVSISTISCSGAHSTMASSNGKWVDTRMLKIIRRAVQDQAIRGHEREDMEQFLSIPSPAPVAANLPTSPVAQHRPPGYMEARDKGRKPCSTTAATAGPVLRLRLIDQENLYAWHDSDRLPWAELSRTAIEYRWATG